MALYHPHRDTLASAREALVRFARSALIQGIMHFAYLLRCADGTLYAGYTRDLKSREARHNAGHGGRYTSGRLPVRVIYSERFKTQQRAMAREAQLKRLTKDEKEALIKHGRPAG